MPSETHRQAVVRQDNGELQEDVVPREELARALRQRPRDDQGQTDQQSDESFPASDAPSDWAGPGERGPAGTVGGAGEVVEERPVAEVPERAEPGDPVPGTVPRAR